MSKIKILFLPDAGPDNPFQYLLVKELKRLGNEVYLGKKRQLFTLITSVWKYKPDLVYFDWIHSFLIGQKVGWSLMKSITFSVEVVVVKYVFRKKIVHTIHNIHSHAKRAIAIEKFFYRWFLKQCDQVRVYDESTISKINAYLGINIRRYVVSPDLPYTLHYTDRVSRPEALAYFGVKQQRFTYLFIGNIKPYKGVEDLIDVFRDPVFQNDYLVLAGRLQKGEFESFIHSKIKGVSNIHLVNDFISEEALKYYMALADVAVFPFKNIEHSGSVELAMTFGKAIVTTETPSMMSLLSHQRSLLYSDTTDLSKRMLAAKSIDLNETGEKNRNKIASVDYQPLLQLFHV